MNNNWATWSIKHKQVIYFFIMLCLVMGLYSYSSLGRSEDPSFTIKQMVVSASWPGASAKEVEQHLTNELEKQLQAVPNVDYLTSYSRAGVCVINVYLKEEVNGSSIKQRWLELRNIVNDGKNKLPNGVYGPFFNDRFDDVYGNIYAITSESFSYEELRQVAEKIKNEFFQVPDVQKVELVGVQPEKIFIQIANTKLAQLGIPLDTLAGIIQAETAVAPAGMTESGDDNVYLRLTGSPDTLENIRNIPIQAAGRTFRLGDIAEVKRGYAEPAEPKMYFNGQPAVGIALSMEDGGDNIKLGANLDRKIVEIKKDLPLGFEFSQVANQPEVVKNSISEFMQSLWEAIIIVLAVSLLTLGRRCGYVISVCIPLVLFGSFIGMFALGIDLHKISLGALIISLGMLVDDAIVVVELMESKMAEGWERTKAASFAFQTTAKPLLIGTMITCAGFMPIAFAKSSASEFAGSLFPVISITLLLSWLIAATVAPVLGYAWIHPQQVAANVTYNTPFYQAFRSILTWSLSHRRIVVLSTLALFFSSLLLLKFIDKEFFPSSVRPEILVELNLPEGTSIKATDQAAVKLTNLIKTDPDVASVSSYVGKSAPRFVLVMEPVQPRNNYAQLVVVAKTLDARLRLEQKIKELVADNLPNVVSYSRSIPLGPPTAYPVMLRVSAPTDALTKEYAEKVRQVMATNPGITMTRFDWIEKAKNVKVTIDNDKLRQMGLTRKTVATALQAEISGYTVAQYLEGDQTIDLVFRLEPRDHANINDLAALTIPTTGGSVQLAQVAHLAYDAEENMLWRRNLQPTITVCGGIGAGVTGNDVTQEVYDSLSDLRRNLPTGVTIAIDGPLEKSNNTLGALLRPIPIMILVMLVLLIIQLQDIRKLVIIFCTAPLGIIGVLLGLVFFNASLGFMAELGVLALTGTIIRNSVVLIDQIDQHLEAGMTPWTAVVESAIVRYRPIMLAALTTILGLVPMFASQFWRSMSIAMACGLTGATVLTLIVLPVLYAIAFQVKNEK
ncbi:MAG: efflux RND transporter permease subunit [Acidaminococcaceae bacterium]